MDLVVAIEEFVKEYARSFVKNAAGVFIEASAAPSTESFAMEYATILTAMFITFKQVVDFDFVQTKSTITAIVVETDVKSTNFIDSLYASSVPSVRCLNCDFAELME